MVVDHISFIILNKEQGNDRFDCHSNSFCALIFVVVLCHLNARKVGWDVVGKSFLKNVDALAFGF